MKIESKPILIVSNEPWGNIWFSKQHYANELSKLENIVYFVNPPKKWTLVDVFNYKIESQKINNHLCKLDYQNNIPNPFQNSSLTKLNDFLFFLKLRKIIPQHTHLILWSFDPFRFISSPFFKKIKRIYHVVDPYMIYKFNQQLAEKANLIVCSSITFFEYYITHFPKKNTIHIPHGISDEEFNIDVDQVIQIKKKYDDFIILIGTINTAVNFTLIEKIVKETTIPLIVIGEEIELSIDMKEKWDTILNNNKIKFIGVIPAQELKNWVSASKICLVTYHYNHPHQTTLKMLNYLAFKKPIISTMHGEFLELNNNAIYTANTDTEFIGLLKKGIKNELYVDKDRINTELKNRSYPTLINQILNTLYQNN